MRERRLHAIDAAAVAVARTHVLPSDHETARALLEATCDSTRLNIVRALRPGPLAASDLALVLGRTASATSQHLRVLREIGAVVPQRSGTVIRYRLSGGDGAATLVAIANAFDRLA